MSETTTNGRPMRRQLSDQIDRLDAILDGLADALNGAVHDASREGVRVAVKEAVIELLTSSDLRAALHTASAPEGEPRPSVWNRLKEKMRRAAARVRAVAVSAGSAVAARVTGACAAMARLASRARQSRQVRMAVRLFVGVAAIAAVVWYATARGFGTMFSSLKTTVTTAAERMSGWARMVVYPTAVT